MVGGLLSLLGGGGAGSAGGGGPRDELGAAAGEEAPPTFPSLGSACVTWTPLVASFGSFGGAGGADALASIGAGAVPLAAARIVYEKVGLIRFRHRRKGSPGRGKPVNTCLGTRTRDAGPPRDVSMSDKLS